MGELSTCVIRHAVITEEVIAEATVEKTDGNRPRKVRGVVTTALVGSRLETNRKKKKKTTMMNPMFELGEVTGESWFQTQCSKRYYFLNTSK